LALPALVRGRRPGSRPAADGGPLDRAAHVSSGSTGTAGARNDRHCK